MTPRTLKAHEKVHSSERPFECKSCQKSFKISATLKQHLVTHTGKRPFKCETCHKSYKKSSALLEHEKFHTRKQFVCNIWEKLHSNQLDLKNHQKIHSGEKYFECNACGKSLD